MHRRSSVFIPEFKQIFPHRDNSTVNFIKIFLPARRTSLGNVNSYLFMLQRKNKNITEILGSEVFCKKEHI